MCSTCGKDATSFWVKIEVNMKSKDLHQFSNIHAGLVERGFELDSPYVAFKDAISCKGIYFSNSSRKFRFLLSSLTLDIGDNDFDRWANSVECSIYFRHLDADLFFRKLDRLVLGRI